ncbi:ABC transporter permease [Curtobacterium ammoniigenes]|uniref:ABC transporter permease n=1 Tax=Curtobacterium ammoniigenes TaxID=395387 RepID=UPI000A5F6579|nr:ABC transporter permease subunit [Curtobacterium ammoniigenes]
MTVTRPDHGLEARGGSATGLQAAFPPSGSDGADQAGRTASARRAARRRSAALGLALVAAPVLVVIVFVGVPVVDAFAFSVGYTGGINEALSLIGQDVVHGFSGAVYATLFSTPTFVRDVVATLGVTVLSTGITLVLALLVATILRLRGGRVGSALSVLAVMPIFVPVVIASWAILTFYDGTGFLRSVFASVGLAFPTWGYTLVAVVIGSVWTSLPFAVLMVAGALQSVPDALIETARDAGASTWRVIWRILLPMASTQIVIATTFTVIGVLGSFTVPYFLGPNAPTMLGVDIVQYFQSFNRPQESTAQAFVIFGFAALASIFYLWSTVRSNRSALEEDR